MRRLPPKYLLRVEMTAEPWFYAISVKDGFLTQPDRSECVRADPAACSVLCEHAHIEFDEAEFQAGTFRHAHVRDVEAQVS